eukprot:scaffold141942_cov15-Tisochrysis_lutea.AAC.1
MDLPAPALLFYDQSDCPQRTNFPSSTPKLCLTWPSALYAPTPWARPETGIPSAQAMQLAYTYSLRAPKYLAMA